MPSGELKINGEDRWDELHLSISDGGKAALMCPAPNKDRAYNQSRLRHGREVAGTLEKKESREISLPMHITAPNAEAGLRYFENFCEILDKGNINIELPQSLPGTVFKCKYISCTNFTEFRNEIFKFTLKLEEPNPTDRRYENI